MKYIELTTETGKILVEVRESLPSGRIEVSNRDGMVRIAVGKLSDAVDGIFENIKSMVGNTFSKISELDFAPDEIEMKLGVSLNAESGQLVSLLASCGGEANIEFTFKWNIEKPKPKTT